MLRGGMVRTIYEMHGQGQSIRAIAAATGLSRNTVRKYLRSPGVPVPKKRPKRTSVLEPFKPYLQERLAEGIENCEVLLRELKARGYQGSSSTLRAYVHPLRRGASPKATMRFETQPGEQAQVDWGEFRYQTPEGGSRRVWCFVMVFSWSRAMYLEFVPKADTTTFIRCHLNAFAHLGGVPQRCLYDNTKLVVLDRDDNGVPQFNERFLDFALRLGLSIQLCHPYRAQTKGRVESGVKYVRHNFWPTARFTDLPDLNQQGRVWCETVANVRVHGTTCERPCDRLQQERPHLKPLPGTERLQTFLRDERRVGRDGFVRWERAAYGVPWAWAGKNVQVQASETVVEIWAGDRRLAVHPRATRPGQHLYAPDQWKGLPHGEGRPKPEPGAVQVANMEVEQRPLAVYEQAAGG
jgi:transposase